MRLQGREILTLKNHLIVVPIGLRTEQFFVAMLFGITIISTI